MICKKTINYVKQHTRKNIKHVNVVLNEVSTKESERDSCKSVTTAFVILCLLLNCKDNIIKLFVEMKHIVTDDLVKVS